MSSEQAIIQAVSTDKMNYVLRDILSGLFRSLTIKYYKDDVEDKRAASYSWGYIPNDRELYEMLVALTRLKSVLSSRREPSFIELGCGIGIYAEMASLRGFVSTGIDINPRLIAAGKELFRNPWLKLYVQDLRQKKFYESLSAYDIIYFYSLFKGGRAAQFIVDVVSHAKKGAFLLMTTHCSEEWCVIEDMLAEKVIVNSFATNNAPFVFQKVGGGKGEEDVGLPAARQQAV